MQMKEDLDVVGGARAGKSILDGQAPIFKFEATAVDQGAVAVMRGFGEGFVVGRNFEGAGAATEAEGAPDFGLVATVNNGGAMRGGSALPQAFRARFVGACAGIDDDALARVGHFEGKSIGMGVPFRMEYVRRMAGARRRDYPLIDNEEMGFPLLTGAHGVTDAVST